MNLRVGMKVSAKKVWEELFKNYAGPFDVKVYRASGVVHCDNRDACIITEQVKVTDIRLEDGVLVIECVGF